MIFPIDFDQSTEVLRPEFDNDTNTAIEDLDRRGFSVRHGLTPAMVDQIAAMAKEEHIREYCPRDCTDERFATLVSTRAWLARGHAVFLLVKKDDNQPVGYGWSGPKTSEEVPGGETTFAIRIAEAGLGQKLSWPFSQVILGATIKLYGAKSLWLETWESNQGAHRIYEKLGFKPVAKKPGSRPTADGGRAEDVRLFMSLPDSS